MNAGLLSLIVVYTNHMYSPQHMNARMHASLSVSWLNRPCKSHKVPQTIVYLRPLNDARHYGNILFFTSPSACVIKCNKHFVSVPEYFFWESKFMHRPKLQRHLNSLYLVEVQIGPLEADSRFVAHGDQHRIWILKLRTLRSLRRHQNKMRFSHFWSFTF